MGAVHVEPARSDLHEAPGETRGAGDASPDWWSRLTAEELARFTHEGRRAVALHLQRDELEHATERGNSDTQVRVAHNLLSISIGTILDQVGLYEESQGNTEVLMSDTRTGFPKAGEKWTRVEIDKRTYRVDHEVFPEFAEVERMLRVLSKPAATVQMEPAILEQVIARCDEALAAIADHPYTKD